MSAPDRLIPYVPEDLAEPKEIVDAVRKRRGGKLMNLDRMLLHSPVFAQGWNTFMGAVRTELQVPWKLREIAMCVVAVCNEAWYEVGLIVEYIPWIKVFYCRLLTMNVAHAISSDTIFLCSSKPGAQKNKATP